MNYDPENLAHRRELGDKLIATLQEKKFKEETNNGERVFSFPVKDQMRVVIYTSVAGRAVRQRAKDAIRVCGVYTARRDNKDRGLIKSIRVNRVGTVDDIIARTFDRAREVWKKIQTGEICRYCGAPMFQTKANKLACAELCWLDKTGG